MSLSERAGFDLEEVKRLESEAVTADRRLCRMCLMAVIVFAFGKEALMFI